MKPNHAIAATLALLLIAPTLAAKPGNMTTMNPALIPHGLDTRDAKAAMVQAIAQKDITQAQDTPQGDATRAWTGIVDSLLSARVWGYKSQFNASATRALRYWYIESVDDTSVTYGYKAGKYYLSVRYDITQEQITPKILLSENLKQKGDTIHPSAIDWISALTTEIRKTLGQFSALKSEIMTKK